MNEILRRLEEQKQRRADYDGEYQAQIDLSRKRAAEFITLMRQNNIAATGCYTLETSRIAPATYNRLGEGWIIIEANDPYDRTGTVLLETGYNYSYQQVDTDLAQGQISESPFIVLSSQAPNTTDPVSPVLYADDRGLSLLTEAAQRLGVLPRSN